jgi:hypothetical protein
MYRFSPLLLSVRCGYSFLAYFRTVGVCDLPVCVCVSLLLTFECLNQSL